MSRSGFYAWLSRTPSALALRAERIEAKIAWFHGESDEVSGSPRILADLREDGEIISCKTVAKTMRRLGLRGVCPRGGAPQRSLITLTPTRLTLRAGPGTPER